MITKEMCFCSHSRASIYKTTQTNILQNFLGYAFRLLKFCLAGWNVKHWTYILCQTIDNTDKTIDRRIYTWPRNEMTQDNLKLQIQWKKLWAHNRSCSNGVNMCHMKTLEFVTWCLLFNILCILILCYLESLWSRNNTKKATSKIKLK